MRGEILARNAKYLQEQTFFNFRSKCSFGGTRLGGSEQSQLLNIYSPHIWWVGMRGEYCIEIRTCKLK